ncbi:AraC family transcriptional regulator [Halalkalibacter hemicellulosilyticus]|uniref:Two-component response regulator n=1 Tax=Halalkalibacter hemicellulosilyticusJCM 9152 TaxID=1236971 RepID=W4QLY9_9BACI|nr:AraC family transcriptional regulator [Halalkalibacter hemicellulosilyticus]GAE32902.1 two-component response regulator [Halalkalibacter hemicellulosilyticusJCM 9152]
MKDERKYYIDGSHFSIQYMYQTGYSKMARPHSHSTYELFYIFHGSKYFFINDTVYLGQKGDLIFIQPNDIHRTSSSDELECERMLMNVSNEFIGLELSRFQASFAQFTRSLFRFRVDEQPLIEEVIEKMYRESRERRIGYEACVRSALTELFVQMKRVDVEESNRHAHSDHPLQQKVTEVASYIRKHYEHTLTLDEVAKAVYISPAYLSRSFKRLTGFTFKDYVQAVRIREAKRLLRETSMPIGRVAELVGFSYTANFNVTFKKITGVTPLAYRKQKRE